MSSEAPAVKICGVTHVDDAERAIELGASFLGLNFHPPSPRFLEVEAARRLAEAVRGRVELVGIFVNRELAEVMEVGERVGLDLYQFHGDESAASIAPVAGRSIKALRLRDGWQPEDLGGYSETWGLLLEKRHPELYGGAGESWSYADVGRVRTPQRLFVAGGIRPGNARQAWLESGAWGVDVCSGVESRPGRKDPQLLEALFAELRMAGDV